MNLVISKYPKTDYTYSPLSRDRVELAPGQVAVPNMSRRSLSQFRIQGPNTDEVDIPLTSVWKTSTVRKRFTTIDSSDDESYVRNGAYKTADDRWWITRLMLSIISSITTTTRNTYRRVVGPSHRYPYTERRPVKKGIVSQTASIAAAPFYWIYTIIKTVVTTTVTTVTETLTSHNVNDLKSAASYEKATKRRLWPWMLLFLLPLGYGLHYTYENFEHLALANFTDFNLDLSEFTTKFANLSLPDIPRINLTLPDINITMPDIKVPDMAKAMPVMTKTYTEYKAVVQNRMADASDYLAIVADSCWEELRRYWAGVIG